MDSHTTRTKVELDTEESILDENGHSLFVNSTDNIQMRVAVICKILHTAQSPDEFSMDQKLLNSCDWDKLNGLFNDIVI